MADKTIWQERKRLLFFGLPWTFTKYKLYNDKFQICTGFLSKKEEEIRLYRIMDTTLHRSLMQRIFGLGTIKVNSADKTTPEFFITNVKASDKIRDLLSDKVEEARKKHRVSGREYMSYSVDDDDDDDDDDH